MAIQDYPFVKCTNPSFMVDRLTGKPVLVPCGKCQACLNQKADRYTLQCKLESQSVNYTRIVTLTFAQTSVPRLAVRSYSVGYHPQLHHDLIDKETGEVVYNYVDNPGSMPLASVLDKQHCFGDFMYLDMSVASLFVKRLRSFLSRLWHSQKRYYNYLEKKTGHHESNIFQDGTVPPIRTFIAGEYAPDHWRPHFHILFFFDSDWIAGPADLYHGTVKTGFSFQRHTLSEFPEWTWSKNPDFSPSPDDTLSILEYAVRSCWTFGINETAIPKGDTSSYVASYVNSSMSLPRIFQANCFRPRCLHSNFLGQRFLKEERAQVYNTPVKSFIRRCYECNGDIKQYNLWRSAYSVYYPRIRGYSIKSSQELFDSYTVYYRAVQIFGRGAKTSFIAREIVDEIIRSIHDPSLCSYDTKFVELCRFFKSEFYDTFAHDLVTTPVDQPLFQEVYFRWYVNIYSFLRVSKHFCTFCSDGFDLHSFRVRLKSVIEFYKTLDYWHLTDWYKSQQKYFEKDFACSEDVVYFYNNVEFNLNEFKSSFLYKKYYQYNFDRFRERVKHKSTTHLNLEFDYG